MSSVQLTNQKSACLESINQERKQGGFLKKSINNLVYLFVFGNHLKAFWNFLTLIINTPPQVVVLSRLFQFMIALSIIQSGVFTVTTC